MATRAILLPLAVLAALTSGCSTDTNGHREGRGEHMRDGGEHGGEGEESGTELSLAETLDTTRHGSRLVLAYDADSRSFTGTVKNTTEATLDRVRVEVHLSNGRELGPTTPVALAPGAEHAVKLTAEQGGFERWSAHVEVGNEEHGHGGEHGGERRGEHGGEHREEHRDELR